MSAQPKPQCKALNRTRGGQCRSSALYGEEYCVSHLRYVGDSERKDRAVIAYVNDELSDWVKREAKEAGLSVSKWLERLLEREKKRSEK